MVVAEGSVDLVVARTQALVEGLMAGLAWPGRSIDSSGGVDGLSRPRDLGILCLENS